MNKYCLGNSVNRLLYGVMIVLSLSSIHIVAISEVKIEAISIEDGECMVSLLLDGQKYITGWKDEDNKVTLCGEQHDLFLMKLNQINQKCLTDQSKTTSDFSINTILDCLQYSVRVKILAMVQQ